MLKYSFIESKETVKTEINVFIAATLVDQLIAETTIYDGEAQIKPC